MGCVHNDMALLIFCEYYIRKGKSDIMETPLLADFFKLDKIRQ